ASDLAKLPVHVGGGSKHGEDPPAVFRRAQGSAEQRPVLVLDASGRPDVDREILVQPLALAQIERGQDLGAVGEVLIDKWPADTGAVGDGLNRHVVQIVDGNQSKRRIEQGFAAVGTRQPRTFERGRWGGPGWGSV